MGEKETVDPLADHEAEWGVPSSQWSDAQWKVAAQSLSRSVVEFHDLCVDWRESFEKLFEDYKDAVTARFVAENALEEARRPKKRGRPKKRVLNALHPDALRQRRKTGIRGRPRKHSKADDEGLVFVIDHEVARLHGVRKRSVTVKAAAKSLIEQWRADRRKKGLPPVTDEVARAHASAWARRYYAVKASGYKKGKKEAEAMPQVEGGSLMRYRLRLERRRAEERAARPQSNKSRKNG